MKLALPLLVGLALASSGCVVHTSGRATVRTSGTVAVQARYTPPSYVVVHAPPPPLRSATVRTARPSTQAIWVDGYWDLRGNQWVWVDGHWFTPQPGYVWEAPVVVVVEGGGYQYHPGYWRRPQQAPPPVYRASGTVRVSVGEPPVVRVRPSEVHQSTVVVRP
ncbi:MAG: YXWGXW repeat-containing protein, partial [Myxococcales bacterium]|nr:YXWGXW repeat-containing protein [Myxococcales bacterium]